MCQNLVVNQQIHEVNCMCQKWTCHICSSKFRDLATNEAMRVWHMRMCCSCWMYCNSGAEEEGTNWKTGLEQNWAHMSWCFIKTSDAKRVKQNEFGICCPLFRLTTDWTAYSMMITTETRRVVQRMRCINMPDCTWNRLKYCRIEIYIQIHHVSSYPVDVESYFIPLRPLPCQTSLPHCRASGRGCCPDGPCLGGRNGTKLQVACQHCHWRKTVELGVSYISVYIYTSFIQ